MSISDFELIKELGKGAFANVWLARRRVDNIFYAIKRINLKTASQKSKENALSEIRILASIQHPNVVDYKEAFYDDESGTLNIVMECADDGDLQAKINKYKLSKTWIPEKDIWSYLIQILQGLKSLHDHKIMHRDLKTANVFVHKNGNIKLGDMNVSKELESGFLVTQTGTPYYASPEVWSERPYDYKSDIWSLGCIIYELCALKLPFRGKNIDQLFKSVLSGIYDPLPNYYSKDLQHIIALMLKLEPTKRPNCDSLLTNPLISKKITNQIETVVTPLLDKIKWPGDDMTKLHSVLPKCKRYPVVAGKRSVSKDRKAAPERSSKENYNPVLYKSNQQPEAAKVKVLTLFNKEPSNPKVLASKSPAKLNDRYNHLDKNRKCSVSKVNKVNPSNILVFLNKYGYNNNKLKQVAK
jgi:serine/threonine protein kinase